jgi:MFS family permease
MGVLHHIVPYLTDIDFFHDGHGADVPAYGHADCRQGAGGQPGRPAGLLKSYLVCMAGLIVAILLLYGAQFLWVAVVFSVLFGFSIAVRTVLPPLMTAKVLGRSISRDLRFAHNLHDAGEAVGVPLSGFIYDWTKSYSLAFALYICLCLIAAVAGIV